MNIQQNNIYRLIKPYQSNKVYEAKTTLHGAGKCYRELKKGNIKCDSFTIMNINDKSIYDFKMNNKKTEEMILKKDPTELINQNGGNNNILETRIVNLENKINNLENNINNINNIVNKK